jgi:cytochrome c biogenesis protein CcmG/thiol:disulfide interchange protein DsbE
MKIQKLRAAAAFALVAALGTITLSASGDARLAPSISLPDRDGATTSLQSLKGKVVLVDIWASWCIPCRAAFPAYDRLYHQYHEKGFEVLAVNVDEKRSAAEAFLEGRDYKVRVLFDPKGLAPTSFNLQAMPTSYLIDKHGVVRFAYEGFNEKLMPRYRREIEQLMEEAP